MRIPQVMAHCWKVMTRPLISRGAISAWYTGTTADATPTPRPERKRPIHRTGRPFAPL
jgi:hypothetical protein